MFTIHLVLLVSTFFSSLLAGAGFFACTRSQSGINISRILCKGYTHKMQNYSLSNGISSLLCTYLTQDFSVLSAPAYFSAYFIVLPAVILSLAHTYHRFI